MNNRFENIFYNVIKNETSLTEVFCNLMKFKSFRHHFINFITEKDSNFSIFPSEISFENFQTEKNFGFKNNEEDKRVGRGDLILEIDNKEYIFELKIETSTDFTKNQPDGYINYLVSRKQTKNDLYFILPKEYKNLSKLNKIDDTHIFFWEDFIESLESNGITDLIYVKDFCEILNHHWFYFQKFEFTKYEKNIINCTEEINMNNKTIPIIISKLFENISIIENGFINKSQTNQYKDSLQYGFFLKNEDKEDILWFGIDYKFWEETGFPLSIGIAHEDEIYLQKFKDYFKNEIIQIEYDKGNYFYHLPVKIEDNLDTKDIKNKINEVKTIIGL